LSESETPGQVKQGLQRGREEAERMREDLSQQPNESTNSPASVPVR
jgi:hypothetical protein